MVISIVIQRQTVLCYMYKSLILNHFSSWRRIVRFYSSVAIPLAIIIVLLAAVGFVASAISSAIRTDVATANTLAVKLRAQLGPPLAGTQEVAPTVGASLTPESRTSARPPAVPPPGLSTTDVITELAQFASTIREIYARAEQLNSLVPWVRDDPFADSRGDRDEMRHIFELEKGLPNLPQAAFELTKHYQDVRHFAQSLLDKVSFWYFGFTIFILPVFCALLGTLAYRLRSFEQQMRTRTFVPARANSARFLIGAMAGAVVGLFSNFSIEQEASIPPLAVAFLVGYAVDPFFAFLDGLLQTFTKRSPASPMPTPPQAGAKT